MRGVILDAAARSAHESHRAFRIAHGHTRHLPYWEQIPEDDRERVRASVRRVAEGCGARELHEAWVSDMVRLGWKWASRRDVMGREDPKLVNWDSLAPVERDEWVLFAGVVRAVLACFPERRTTPMASFGARASDGLGKGRRP